MDRFLAKARRALNLASAVIDAFFSVFRQLIAIALIYYVWTDIHGVEAKALMMVGIAYLLMDVSRGDKRNG